MKTRIYPARHLELAQVATVIQADLTQAGFDVRVAPITPPHVGLFLEIRRPSHLVAHATGKGAALNVWLTPEPVGFRLQVGTGRWGDKAAGAVEWLLATPALVTEGYAAFQQSQLDERVLRVVDQLVAQGAGVPVDRAPAPVPAGGACAACATPMPFGARFCPRCGRDAHARVGVACADCRAPLALEARFCPSCGRRITEGTAERASACTRCSMPLDPGARFCPSCGASTAEDDDATRRTA